ncbi:MAG: hypothetical protein R2861_03770 [Desulfobacterales bacterium]
MNSYSIYSLDIKPKGFSHRAGRICHLGRRGTDPENFKNSVLREDMTRHNYDVARRFYSYTVLEQPDRHIKHHRPCTHND